MSVVLFEFFLTKDFPNPIGNSSVTRDAETEFNSRNEGLFHDKGNNPPAMLGGGAGGRHENISHSNITFLGVVCGFQGLLKTVFWVKGPANQSFGLEQGPFDPKLVSSRPWKPPTGMIYRICLSKALLTQKWS